MELMGSRSFAGWNVANFTDTEHNKSRGLVGQITVEMTASLPDYLIWARRQMGGGYLTIWTRESRWTHYKIIKKKPILKGSLLPFFMNGANLYGIQLAPFSNMVYACKRSA
jgi:hypothetical protein